MGSLAIDHHTFARLVGRTRGCVIWKLQRQVTLGTVVVIVVVVVVVVGVVFVALLVVVVVGASLQCKCLRLYCL